jgi:D-alanyl-D-alanine carboxypeptidase
MYQLYLPQFFSKEVVGGMASYSDTAGAGLACLAEDEGMSLIIITMGGVRTHEDNGWQVKYYGNFEEVMDLLEFSFEGFRICRLLYPGQTLGQFAVLDGDCKLVGQSATSFDSVVPVNVNMRNLTLRYNVKDGGLKAPIKKDEEVGTVQIWFRTSCITETQIYAMHDVATATDSGVEIQTGPIRSDRGVTDILIFLGIACLVIIIPLSIYIGINAARRAMRRAKRRRRRASRRRSR